MKRLWQEAVDQHGKWLPVFASLFAFFMPLCELLLPVLLVFFMVSWWMGAPTSFQWRWRTPLPWTLLLYVFHLIGMAWSTNMEYGLFDLEIKLSLLFLPLVGMIKVRQTRTLIPPVLFALCLGNVAAVLAGLANVIGVTAGPTALPAEQVIFGPAFAYLLHASYFSLQLNFSIAGIFLTPLVRILPRWSLLLLLPILCTGIVLAGSKIGWLTLPMILIWMLIKHWRSAPIRNAILMLAFVAFIGITGLIVFSSFARERVVEMTEAVLFPQVQADAGTSTEIRKMAWTGAWEVIADHFPWGTGTGDVKDELISVYETRGFVALVEKRINAHSQFLQMFAALGIIGVLLTFAMLIAPLLRPWYRMNQLLIVFLMLCTLNWAVESMLEVQAGVLFFAFFALLLPSLPEPYSRDPIQPAEN